eukprot:scaffold55790_cov52-Cyclotella_meneghiniana.AAC.1
MARLTCSSTFNLLLLKRPVTLRYDLLTPILIPEHPILETSRAQVLIPILDTRTKARVSYSSICRREFLTKYPKRCHYLGTLLGLSILIPEHPNKGARVLEYYPSTYSNTIVSSGNTRTHPPELNFARVQKAVNKA